MEQNVNDRNLSGGMVKLLTKKQTAAELGISYRTIERWYNIGYIKRIRIGGRIFFSYSEIIRLRDQYISEEGVSGRYLEPQIRTVGDIQSRFRHAVVAR